MFTFAFLGSASPLLPDVQKTRVAVIKAYNDAPQPQKAGILKDVVVVLMHSVTPPGEQ